MQIACPSCKTRISVPDDKIKPEGTKVKCGKCSKIFTVKKKAAGDSPQAKVPAAAAPESGADPLFSDAPAPPKPPAPAPPESAAPSTSDELGLGRSSAPVSDDESFFGGDNFGGEMDNYKTQLRPMAGRDSAMFGNSDQLDREASAPAKPAARSNDLFGSSDDELFLSGDPAPAKAPAKKPADEDPRKSRGASVMPPKESLDDLFGKGLDDEDSDVMVNKLLEPKPKKALETDDLFGPPDPVPPPPPPAPRAAPAPSKLDDLFDDDPAPAAPPPARASAPPSSAAPRGPSAEDLAATLKLEPALKEEDFPKAPPPKPAEVKPAAKKRKFPVKALVVSGLGLLLAGAVASAMFVPAIQAPVKGLWAQMGILLESTPTVEPTEKLDFTATVTAARMLVGGRGDKLYVVEGMVQNDYPGPRSFIKLRGNLVGADGAVMATREVFAGNTLNDEEIRGLERVKIDGTLSRSVGGGLRNFNVPPGASIPFQIVFYDVEQPVQTQTIEPIGSEPGN